MVEDDAELSAEGRGIFKQVAPAHQLTNTDLLGRHTRELVSANAIDGKEVTAE